MVAVRRAFTNYSPMQRTRCLITAGGCSSRRRSRAGTREVANASPTGMLYASAAQVRISYALPQCIGTGNGGPAPPDIAAKPPRRPSGRRQPASRCY